jgi:hypothetical protein
MNNLLRQESFLRNFKFSLHSPPMKKFCFIFTCLSLFFVSVATADASFLTQNISPRTIPRNAVRLPILKILVPAAEQNRRLQSVDLRLSGLIENNDISRAWVETANGQRSFSRSFGADYRASLPFRSTVIIPANQSTELYVLVNLAATANRSFQVQVESIDFEDVNIEPIAPIYKPFQSKNYRSNSYFNRSRLSAKKSAPTKKFSILCKNSKCQRVYK